MTGTFRITIDAKSKIVETSPQTTLFQCHSSWSMSVFALLYPSKLFLWFTLVNFQFFFHSGMVSICAGCNIMQPWGACITGTMAGIVYLGTNLVLFLAKTPTHRSMPKNSKKIEIKILLEIALCCLLSYMYQ